MNKKKNLLLFKSLAILSPFVLLFLLEILLRVFGYGNNMDLFVGSKNNGNLLVLNPAASCKYFVNERLAPTGNREFFKKKKEANTIRIFVLGESTTIGYPYFHNGSFSRFLLYRLMHTLPDQQFEIINLSLTGVNSYTVLGFAKELVQYEPDAVLIYSGQNEYYGALGVGSTNRLGNNRLLIGLMLRLRKLRIIQLFSNLYEKIIHSPLFSKKTTGGTLMQMMVADQQIPYQSTLYYKGIEQFRLNLDETLHLFNGLQIPVFVSTLVSNEKDLKPFVDIPADSSRFRGFRSNYAAGVKALEDHDSVTAWRYLKRANDVYDKDALCNYYLGLLACSRTEYPQAGDFFSKARDLDGLRFRAPSAMNLVIRELCNVYPYAHLVDSRAEFEHYSNEHLIGNDLMLEHVHPNLKGYAILSDAFFRAIKDTQIIPVPAEKEMSLEQLQEQMPVTRMDSLSGIYRIAKLKKSWPFQGIKQQDSFNMEFPEERLAHELVFGEVQWPDAIDSLYNYYLGKNDLSDAATVMETLVLEHPAEASQYEKTAMLFGKMNDLSNSVFYFRKAFALSPSTEMARYLFVIYFKLDKPAEATAYLDYSIQNSSGADALVAIKSLAAEIIELQKKYIRDSTGILIPNQIAALYFRMGNKEVAEKYAEKVLKTDSRNKDALLLLSTIKKG